jgi:hypothetical protein
VADFDHRILTMTRYTNTGRKRTYLEAGFEEKHASESPEPEAPEAEEPQTKRKRGDKKVKRVKGMCSVIFVHV